MVKHIPLKKFAVYAPGRWNDAFLLCWEDRSDLELLREHAGLDLFISPPLFKISKFHESGFEVEKFYQWRISSSTQEIEGSDLVPDRAFLDLSLRYSEWLQGLTALKDIIDFFRRKNSHRSWEKQDIIYREKVSEAQKVLAGETTGLIFLPLEASQREISIEDLANDILTAHRLEMAALSKTEAMRISWMSQYKTFLTDDGDIKQFVKEKYKEAYDHQRS